MEFETQKYIDQSAKLAKRLIESQTDPYLHKVLTYHYSKNGKCLRSRIGIELGSVFGLDLSLSMGWVTAVEMLHNSTLIHDDIQDGDEYRRGQESIWKKYGVDHAINAGNILLLIAPLAIQKLKIIPSKKLALLDLYAHMGASVVRGQSKEFVLKDINASEDIETDYENCIENKTGALFRDVVKGICILANKDPLYGEKLSKLFLELGVIFQIQDDILDVYGTKGRDEIATDIKEGKISALLVHFLLSKSSDHEKVVRIIQKSREQTTTEDVDFVLGAFKQENALEKTVSMLKDKYDIIVESELVAEDKDLKLYLHQTLKKILGPIAHIDSIQDLIEGLEV